MPMVSIASLHSCWWKCLPSDGRESLGTDWNTGSFLSIRKLFCAVQVTEHRNSWPGETVDSPPWRSCLDVVVGSVLWVSLLEQWLHRDPELPSELIHLWLL